MIFHPPLPPPQKRGKINFASFNYRNSKTAAVPLQAWSGPECSRKLRFLESMTTAQDGGRLSALRTDNYRHGHDIICIVIELLAGSVVKRVSILGRAKIFLSPPKRPDRPPH